MDLDLRDQHLLLHLQIGHARQFRQTLRANPHRPRASMLATGAPGWGWRSRARSLPRTAAASPSAPPMAAPASPFALPRAAGPAAVRRRLSSVTTERDPMKKQLTLLASALFAGTGVLAAAPPEVDSTKSPTAAAAKAGSTAHGRSRAG